MIYKKIKAISDKLKIGDHRKIKKTFKELMAASNMLGIITSTDYSYSDNQLCCRMGYKLICLDDGDTESTSVCFWGDKYADHKVMATVCERLALMALFTPYTEDDEKDYVPPPSDKQRTPVAPFTSDRPEIYYKSTQLFINKGAKIVSCYEVLMLPFSIEDWKIFHGIKRLENSRLAPMLASAQTGELRKFMDRTYPDFPYHDWDRKHPLFEGLVYDSPLGIIRGIIPTQAEREVNDLAVNGLVNYIFRNQGLGFDRNGFVDFLAGKESLGEISLKTAKRGEKLPLKDFIKCATAAMIAKLCEEYKSVVSGDS